MQTEFNEHIVVPLDLTNTAELRRFLTRLTEDKVRQPAIEDLMSTDTLSTAITKVNEILTMLRSAKIINE